MESKLTNKQIETILNEQFGSQILQWQDCTDLIPTFFVEASDVHALVEWMYHNQELQLQFLTNITAVHYPDNEKGNELVVVYHLHSWINNIRVRIKSYLPIEDPRISTLTDIYAAANWIERETYDLFGVHFIGHPNLKRILNEESMDYFPMRKEYHLEDATRQDKDNRYFGR